MEIQKSSRMLSIAIICVKISTCCPFCFQLPKQDSQSSQLAWLWVRTWGFCRWHSQRQPLHTGVASGGCSIPESSISDDIDDGSLLLQTELQGLHSISPWVRKICSIQTWRSNSYSWEHTEVSMKQIKTLLYSFLTSWAVSYLKPATFSKKHKAPG